MRENEIKEGIQLICDLSKKMSQYLNDKSALISKLNSLHKEDLTPLEKRYKSKSGPVNKLRTDILTDLLKDKKLDEQTFENIISERRNKYEKAFSPLNDFVIFQPFIAPYEHEQIRKFIEQFKDEIIQRLKLKEKFKDEYNDFQGRPHQGAEKFSLAFYNRSQESESTRLQLLIEFEDCVVKYGIKRQKEKHYIEGPEERKYNNFDFESLISFFEENKELIVKDEPKAEPKEDAAKSVLDNTKSQREHRAMKEFPCNIILFGPPGTGKTYNTIDLAVEIITGNRSSHQENKEVFDVLREEGQIEFITFHQNYSYEDFMIGIRPDLDEASALKFRRKEGIFYKMCKRAEQNYLHSQNKEKALRPFKEVFSEFIEPLEKGEVEIEIKMISGKSSFWITEINPSNLSFRKQSGGTTHNTLSIDTIQALYDGTRVFTSGFLRSYYEPLINELWRRGKQTATEVSLKRYVLIIDEINRANISKVFGELITLLEEDKRLGAKNELRISIPGEETGFGIPPNVYVIGTMNTADKSIAMIDIALRRRFEFIGYFPDYSKVDELSGDVLKHINKQIYERKKSADYLIGHGYFMNGGETPETSKVLQNKVIPLLMEYFSGKTEVVEEIFKGSEWSVKYDTEKYCWQINQ